MNLKITTQINTSTGKPITNAICNLSVNTDYLLSQLKVYFEPEFWVDAEAKDNGYDKIIPVVLDDNEFIVQRVGGFSVTLTEQEALALNATSAYQKAEAYLESTYGWTIIIE